MKKPFAILLAAALAVQGGAAFAQSYEEVVLAQLRAQGFVQFTMTTTLLGRIRIIAQGADGQREIVLNPRTGEVLRDVWLVSHARSKGPVISGNGGQGPSSGGPGGSSGSDDDDSDDGDDSPGGGNSGGGNSGGGGNGGGGDDDSDSDSDSEDDDD